MSESEFQEYKDNEGWSSDEEDTGGNSLDNGRLNRRVSFVGI